MQAFNTYFLPNLPDSEQLQINKQKIEEINRV